ncbi:hypothetical protein [Brucella pituitosa]
MCDDCATPLTACWSKGSHARHPYYLCPNAAARAMASQSGAIRLKASSKHFFGAFSQQKSCSLSPNPCSRICGSVASLRAKPSPRLCQRSL